MESLLLLLAGYGSSSIFYTLTWWCRSAWRKAPLPFVFFDIPLTLIDFKRGRNGNMSDMFQFLWKLVTLSTFSCHGSQLRYSAKNKLWLNYFSCLGKLKKIPKFPSFDVCWTGSLGNLSFVTAFCQKKKKLSDFRLVASMRLDKQGHNKENRL